MNKEYIDLFIFFSPQVDSIYHLVERYGPQFKGIVEVTYNDPIDSFEYKSYSDFLEVGDDPDSILDITFSMAKEPLDIHAEKIAYRLKKNGDQSLWLSVTTTSTESVLKFIAEQGVSYITIHNLDDFISQRSTSKKDYILFNKQIEDYLEFYERYDYHYTNDLSIYEESIPGHMHRSGTYNFGSSWQMYYNTEDYYKVIPKPLWDAFTDCEENVVLENGLRKITLYKDQADCQNLQNRARQWAFRRQLGIDSIAHELCGGQDKEPAELPVVITQKNCIIGSTKVTRYLDANNNLVNPSKAVTKEIKEYMEDGITVVFEESTTI